MPSDVVEPVVYYGDRSADAVPVVQRRWGGISLPLYWDSAWTGGALLAYAWGAVCPGGQLLAMAILSDVLGSSSLAALWCEDYAREVVSTWTDRRFVTDSNAVCRWLVGKTVQALRQRDEPYHEARLRERIFGHGCGSLDGRAGQGGGGNAN